jgi:LPXTG-site transpeptidase (sortase) family protein
MRFKLQRILERSLFLAAIVAFGYLGFVTIDRVLYERRAEADLEAMMREAALERAAAPAPPPASLGRSRPSTDPRATKATRAAHRKASPRTLPAQPLPLDGTRRRATHGPLGKLEIRSAGVSVVVGAASDHVALRRSAGHIQGTAYPGDPGNVGIAGHRDTSFRGLRKVKVGDRIAMKTPDGSFEYMVEALTTVDPEDIEVLAPSPYPTLTLVTCYPFDFIGAAPQRFIVRARQMVEPTRAAGKGKRGATARG